MQVSLRYASYFALRELPQVRTRILPTGESFFRVRVVALKLKRSTADYKINADCGRCKEAVKKLNTFGPADSASKNTSRS